MIMRAIAREVGFLLLWIGIGAGFMAICFGWWSILGELLGWPR